MACQFLGVGCSESFISATIYILFAHQLLGFLRKPLNAEAGVVAKEDSIPTILVMLFGTLESILASFCSCTGVSLP